MSRILDVKKPFYYFLVSRALFIIFAYGASLIVPLNEGYLGREISSKIPYLAWVWANFDGRHFIEIASIGYQRFNFVYFPLYPLLVRILASFFSLHPLYSALIVSSLAFIAAIYVFAKLASLDFNQGKTNLSLWVLVLFPTAFFYNSAYSVSLELLVVLLAFLAARKKKWFWAGIFGLLSTANHLTSLAILPALFAEWYLQNKKSFRAFQIFARDFIRRGIWPLAIAVLGIIFYMIYLQVAYGDYYLFMKAFAGWHTRTALVFPLQVVFRYLKILWTVSPSLLIYWIAFLEFAFVVIYLGLAAYTWKRIRLSYAVYMFSVLLISALSGSFIGIPKYVLYFSPGFMAIASLVDRRRIVRIIYFLLTAVLGFVLTALFTRGYFVA